jgi:hypothetical protein
MATRRRGEPGSPGPMRWRLGREELSGFNVPLTVRGNQCPAVGSHVVKRNLTLPRSIVTFAAVVYLALPSVASSKEHRSREVTREFQREHPCLATGKLSAHAQDTGRITSSRSPVAGQMRFGTSNGRPSVTLPQRTGGSGGLAPANRVAVSRRRAVARNFSAAAVVREPDKV